MNARRESHFRAGFRQHRLYLAQLASVFAVAGLGSLDAQASSEPAPLTEVVAPFEGKTVPLNAQLLMAYDGQLVGTLVGPDGEPIEFFGDSGDGVVSVNESVLEPFTLVPGDWQLHLTHIFEEDETRRIDFSVGPDNDDDPPPAPLVTAERRTVGTLFPQDSSESALRDIVSFQASSNAADALMLMMVEDDELHRLGLFKDGEAFGSRGLSDGGEVSFDIVVADFAGNVSEPTIVTVDGGCEGGGCASSAPTLPGTAVGLGVLALLRRRRRHPEP